MKITKSQLREIIREELNNLSPSKNEGIGDFFKKLRKKKTDVSTNDDGDDGEPNEREFALASKYAKKHKAQLGGFGVGDNGDIYIELMKGKKFYDVVLDKSGNLKDVNLD
jgi:hypothetical protein